MSTKKISLDLALDETVKALAKIQKQLGTSQDVLNKTGFTNLNSKRSDGNSHSRSRSPFEDKLMMTNQSGRTSRNKNINWTMTLKDMNRTQ